jgi:hypothetical protein
MSKRGMGMGHKAVDMLMFVFNKLVLWKDGLR